MTWFKFTNAETKLKLLINLQSIDGVEECEFDGVAATDIFINGNRFTVCDKFEVVCEMIERIERGY